MAKRKNLTGFSRLILALLVILPAAFVGASYYNGEDPVQKFKELAGWEQPRTTVSNSSSNRSSSGSASTGGSTNYNNMSHSDLVTRIAVLEEQLARCRAADVE
ncbi:MAG: hypothetical protein AAFO91_00670 [Bacteroidota bacterium]